jgi:hypothetical protein
MILQRYRRDAALHGPDFLTAGCIWIARDA